MSCEICGGYGFVQEDGGPLGIPQARPCECRMIKSLDAQAEKAWKGLSEIKPRKKTILSKHLTKSIILVGEKDNLASHLRSALWDHRRPEKFVKVVSDATLMSAWLNNLSASNREIYDPDFIRDVRASSLEDLVESPSLLIVRLGVKGARNSAMPEVMTETVALRDHLSKPLWIVTEPDRPLEEGHICWSRAFEESIEGWETVPLVKGYSKKASSERAEVSKTKRFNL